MGGANVEAVIQDQGMWPVCDRFTPDFICVRPFPPHFLHVVLTLKKIWVPEPFTWTDVNRSGSAPPCPPPSGTLSGSLPLGFLSTVTDAGPAWTEEGENNRPVPTGTGDVWPVKLSHVSINSTNHCRRNPVAIPQQHLENSPKKILRDSWGCPSGSCSYCGACRSRDALSAENLFHLNILPTGSPSQSNLFISNGCQIALPEDISTSGVSNPSDRLAPQSIIYNNWWIRPVCPFSHVLYPLRTYTTACTGHVVPWSPHITVVPVVAQAF